MRRSLAAAGSAPFAYRFAGFRLRPDGTLLRGETPLYLPPREVALLRLLLARAGDIVSPLELKRALWDEKHVSSDTLSRCFATLRARLQPADCIQSVYKRGYRISAAVQPARPRPARALPRLAILPFAAGFGVPEYFSMAVTEEAMERLAGARYPIVSILARDSVFALARRGLAAHEIGRTLQADLVLTGLLLATPGHDRLRAEMFRAEDGAQLWVEDLLVERDRIGALTSELVSRLTFRLHSGGLSISAAAEPAAESEFSPHRREAHELFLRAHHEWQTFERHRMQDALGGLLRAIELDPSLMAARVDLANLCVTQAIYGVISPMIEAGMVRRASERIPDDAADADALLPSLGWVDFHVDHNLPAALKAFARSAHLPHDPWISRARVLFALSRHRFREAIDLLNAAIALDPYSPWMQARLAWAFHLAGDSAASIAQARQALELFPEHGGSLLYGAIILSYNGEAARATEMRDALAARSLHFDLATATYAYTLACAGRGDEARELLERLQWLGRERFVQNTFNAAVYVVLGEPDAALAELRASLENRCPWFFQTLADPRLKPLWGRPEFEEMRGILTEMEAEAEKAAMG
jgi:DNA-binding winged helix-turn-helix (wHTH) protein/tetratricopeptide (TPR) repeat protein